MRGEHPCTCLPGRGPHGIVTHSDDCARSAVYWEKNKEAHARRSECLRVLLEQGKAVPVPAAQEPRCIAAMREAVGSGEQWRTFTLTLEQMREVLSHVDERNPKWPRAHPADADDPPECPRCLGDEVAAHLSTCRVLRDESRKGSGRKARESAEREAMGMELEQDWEVSE